MILLQLFGGIILLYIGGELIVRNVVSIAHKLGVSPLLISLTVVGFGTSTPELVTCIQAGLAGSSGLALGNIVGSNIANFLLILPAAAIISPLFYRSTLLKRDGPVLILSVIFMIGLVIMTDRIGYLAGSILIICLISYTVFCFIGERYAYPSLSGQLDEDGTHNTTLPLLIVLSLMIIGIVCVLVGASWLVESAIAVARLAGVSESIIGLTMVALGTSLPELATVITASLRGHSDIAFGNVIGSNLYNVFGILGVTALVTPLDVPSDLASLPIWLMGAATLLILLFAATGRQISRLEGIVLLLCYGGYVFIIFTE